MDIERFNDHISQGIALMTEQKYEAAKKEFEAAILIDVKSYDAYIHLGNACANLGKFDDALAAFKNALVVEANSGEALYSIANIYLLKEERLKAVEFYNKAEEAIKTSNGNVEVLEELLGLKKCTLGKNPQLVEITKPDGLRMASGNEFTANDFWRPGGFTSGGLPEVVINSVDKEYVTNKLIFKLIK